MIKFHIDGALPRRALSGVLLLLPVLLFAGHALAAATNALPDHECTLSGAGSCYSMSGSSDFQGYNPYAYYAPQPADNSAGWPFWGGRSDPGMASGPVDVFGTCRYIDNISSGTAVFVPFRSQLEWSKFLAGFPSAYISVATCARPYHGVLGYFGPSSADPSLGDISTDGGGVDTQPANLSLPYARTGTQLTTASSADHTFHLGCYDDNPVDYCFHTVQQTCAGDGCNAHDQQGHCIAPYTYTYDCSYCDQPGTVCQQDWHYWSETFDASYQGLNADTSNPSWAFVASHRIGGSARPASPTCTRRCTQNGHSCQCSDMTVLPVNGQCGPAAGISATSAPAGGLCASGTPSGVTGTGPWSWSCQGRDGGSDISCGAQSPPSTGTCAPGVVLAGIYGYPYSVPQGQEGDTVPPGHANTDPNFYYQGLQWAACSAFYSLPFYVQCEDGFWIIHTPPNCPVDDNPNGGTL